MSAPTITRERFRRELLPSPHQFYDREIGPFRTRPDRKGWALGNCPFHKSKSGRSFSVNLESGAFHCFGCDAHGGDVLQFARLLYKLSFAGALKFFGIEQQQTLSRRPKERPKTLERRIAEAVIDGPRADLERQARVNRGYELHYAKRRYFRIARFLAKDRENEALWAELQRVWEKFMRLDAAYEY